MGAGWLELGFVHLLRVQQRKRGWGLLDSLRGDGQEAS